MHNPAPFLAALAAMLRTDCGDCQGSAPIPTTDLEDALRADSDNWEPTLDITDELPKGATQWKLRKHTSPAFLVVQPDREIFANTYWQVEA